MENFVKSRIILYFFNKSRLYSI